VGWNIGALNITYLALVTEVDDPTVFIICQRHHIAVVLVDGVEEGWKGGTEIKAETTPMTDVEDTIDLLAQSRFVPIGRVIRVVHRE
jgi:hypothetical protein